MKYFEKTSEQQDSGLGVRTIASMMPIIGNYYSTPDSLRKKHPTVATVFGQAGARGANAKNTGKSQLGTAIKENAVMWAPMGAIIGGLAEGALVSRSSIPTGGSIATGILGGAALGAALGAVKAPISYGAGHLFGKKTTNEKKAGLGDIGIKAIKAIKGYGANLSKGFGDLGKNMKFMGSVATDTTLGNAGKKELLGFAGKDALNIIKNNKALKNTLIGAGATGLAGVGYMGYNKVNN